MVIPTSIDDLKFHLSAFSDLFWAKAIPNYEVLFCYFMFFFVQIVLASFMPGHLMEGLPTAPHGKRLPYLCNGYSCYYACIVALLVVNYLGIFKISSIIDNFGMYLFTSMVIGDVTAVLWYLYGLLFADKYNGHTALTGNIIYDIFMGSILYPRIGIVDIKMVAECRWSWITLLLITLSCAFKEYEQYGAPSWNILFMLVAHWLYSNATAKGEHCIPCTWDMFHENYGWMLNFWNICGVPFMYCFQSIYIYKNHEMLVKEYPLPLLALNFIVLLIAYYVFDTANCQKATYKVHVERNTFPQLPWGILENKKCRVLRTPKGNLLLDGWYGFVRKIQYTGDIVMALTWGIACGFKSPLPFFYVTFFTIMINHRQLRDEARCREKYGEYWKEYTKRVPNVFLPSLSFFKWAFFGGKHPHDDLLPKQE